MKKLIITSATVVLSSAIVLFISLTAFAKGNDKSEIKCNEKYGQECLDESGWGKFTFYEDTATLKCMDSAGNKTGCKKSEEKEETNKPQPIPAKKFFMIPMLDSALADTTGGC